MAEETSSATSSSSNDVAARRLYIGNIPRNVDNDELRRIVEEHGAAEKVEVCLFIYALSVNPFGY